MTVLAERPIRCLERLVEDDVRIRDCARRRLVVDATDELRERRRRTKPRHHGREQLRKRRERHVSPAACAPSFVA
jgi:hypothetical protein